MFAYRNGIRLKVWTLQNNVFMLEINWNDVQLDPNRDDHF